MKKKFYLSVLLMLTILSTYGCISSISGDPIVASANKITKDFNTEDFQQYSGTNLYCSVRQLFGQRIRTRQPDSSFKNLCKREYPLPQRWQIMESENKIRKEADKHPYLRTELNRYYSQRGGRYTAKQTCWVRQPYYQIKRSRWRTLRGYGLQTTGSQPYRSGRC